MRIQRNEAAWVDIRFESKTQSTRIYRDWATEFNVQNMGDILTEALVRKAVDVSLDIFIIRSHADLEFLVSRWSTKMHTFITSWEEFTPTLEDILVMFHLPVLVDEGPMGLVMSKREKEKVRLLSAALKFQINSSIPPRLDTISFSTFLCRFVSCQW